MPTPIKCEFCKKLTFVKPNGDCPTCGRLLTGFPGLHMAPAIRYEHTCDECRYLGQYNEYDLYYCPQSGVFPTVLARYGDRGEEYTSGMESEHPALIEARTLITPSEKKGLHDKE